MRISVSKIFSSCLSFWYWCFFLLACNYGGLRLWLIDYCHAQQGKLGGYQNTGFKREVRVCSLNAQSVLNRFSYWSFLNLSIHSTLFYLLFENIMVMKWSRVTNIWQIKRMDLRLLFCFFLTFRTSNYLLLKHITSEAKVSLGGQAVMEFEVA